MSYPTFVPLSGTPCNTNAFSTNPKFEVPAVDAAPAFGCGDSTLPVIRSASFLKRLASTYVLPCILLNHPNVSTAAPSSPNVTGAVPLAFPFAKKSSKSQTK